MCARLILKLLARLLPELHSTQLKYVYYNYTAVWHNTCMSVTLPACLYDLLNPKKDNQIVCWEKLTLFLITDSLLQKLKPTYIV